MKKILLSILLVAAGLSVFSQPATRILNMRPAYPLAIGETTVDSLVYAHNGLVLHDIVQDSLPIYEIGHIFAQTIRFTEEGHGFYIKADSLHSNQVTYSYQTDTLPRGPIEFNSTTGRFIYYPSASDYKTFVVRFMAVSGNDTVWEDVEFNLRPMVVPESFTFQSQGTLPDGMDYITIAETSTYMFLNNENRTAYSYSISGKDIVFDNSVHNKVWGLSGREDIYEMNLYAERLIIRSEIVFPQTNLTIYAKEIIFEDQGGEMASINVSPIPFNTLTNDQGLNGANAGNISLYVKELHGNMGKRLILNGAKGQPSNRNGIPGNGGNGGTVTSTIDIQNYCDFVRGSGGVKFDVASDGSTETGAIIGAGTLGMPGHFEYLNEPYAYLHPYYISAVLRYVNDAFINNYTDYVFQTCKTYKEDIDEYINALDCDTCYTENEIEFQNDLVEIHSILFKIEQGLDYFGNPAGWVPLLSFEVMLANYDNEIDRAIPTLYMYYWLSRVDNSLQQRIAAAQTSTSIIEQELASNEALINTLVLEIPILENKATEISEMIDSVKFRIEVLRDQLMAKARHNVRKKNHILKGVGICKAVANVLPIIGPVGVAISAGVNTVLSSSITSDVLSHLAGVEIDYSSTVQSIGSVSCDTNFFSNLSSALSDANAAIGGDFGALKSAYKSASSAIKPLITNISNVSKLLSTSSAPANEVEAEFNKLAAESTEWKSLEASFNELNQKKNELLLRINQNLMNMTSTLAEVSNDVIALDVFRRDAFTGNSKRDLNAMQYLEKMEQRAKNRLLKYHYYLRKAYEYRLLKPYEGEFNLVGMFERFETLGLTLDSIVDPAAHASLKSVFREVVSEIAEEVIDEYSSNTPEQSVPITIVIPRNQLDILNADGTLTLNFYEMGIFSPDEENVRIVDLGIQYFGSHVDGNIGYSGYMDLNMTHQGISRLRKDGQIYWFDHLSRSTTNPHTWGTRYDAITQTNTPIQPSYASTSLLYSLLNNNNSNMMLFSRPSAWGDINVTKKVHTSGGADIVIDSLVLRLQYDFTTRPANIRNIDITTNEGLLPYIACSEPDRNGRSNGNGNLNRSYTASNQTVTFTAIEKYGTWHFVNWTNRAGAVVSDTMALTATKSTDQFYRANYERRVPILSVPDTIFVNSIGGIYSVPVANIGSGDLEMDWYVSDSLSTWVHLNELVEGIDNGNFSFTYENNGTESYRLDSLEIFAPETDIMSKMIYIVQSGSTISCSDITLPYTENFENYTESTTTATGVEPDCWELVKEDVQTPTDKRPQLYYESSFAHSGNYSLKLSFRGVYAMPELSEDVPVNRVKLEMYLRQANTNYQLQAGIWEDNGNFVPVASFDNTTTNVEYVTCDFSSYTGNGRRIAFRNTLDNGSTAYTSTNYLDDISLTLLCETISLPYTENFESYTTSTTAATGIEPNCWELVKEDAAMPNDKRPQLYFESSFAHSGNYSLKLSNRGVYAMPELSEDVPMNRVKLEMYLRQANTKYQLQVGIWENNGSFVPVATFDNATTDVEFVTCDFSSYTGNGRRIAFRNTLGDGSNIAYSTNYLDDITLSLKPCEKITLPYREDFESYTASTTAATGIEPTCWELVKADMQMPDDKRPQLYYESTFAHSGDYSLKLTYRGVYAMPELSEDVPVNRVKLEMYLRQANTKYQLQAGIWEDNGNFVPVATFDNATTDVEFVSCDFSSYTGNGRRIAFRNTLASGSTASTNYLDDITLTLLCETISLPYTENFENFTTSTTAATGIEPTCWELVKEDAAMPNDKRPQLYFESSFAHSGNYSLKLSNRGVYAMPELSEDVPVNRVKLEMYLRQANAKYQLQVGIWENNGSFVPVASFDNATTNVEYVTCDFSSYTGNGRRIAFRNTLGDGSNIAYSTNYLDDITLSLKPCEKITLPYHEDFESYTASTTAATGIEPTCWELVKADMQMPDDKRPQLYYESTFAHSGDYSLKLSYRGVYAMPELSEDVPVNRVKLEMYLRQANTKYQLQAGIWEDNGNFVPVATFDNTTTNVEYVTCDFSSYTGNGRRIAFRNTLASGSTASTNYLDDISLTLFCETISLPYTENFENFTTSTTAATGIEPTCWELVKQDAAMPDDKRPQLYFESSFAHSGNYSLKLSNRGVYAMPELSEDVPVNQVRLEMFLRQANAKYQLQVGIWEDNGSFVPVATFDNATTDVEFVSCDFSSYTGNGHRIAFRNTLGDGSNIAYSTNYLDDISLTLMEVCSIYLPYIETFESFTTSTTAATGVEPDCWELVRTDATSMPDDKRPQIYYNSSFASSGNYSLKTGNRCVYAMPELESNVPVNQIRLDMYLRQPNAAYRLEVGVWDDATSTFQRVKMFNNSTTAVEHVTCDFSGYNGNGRRIAFRNTLSNGKTWDYSYNYIDDINLLRITNNKNAEVTDANTTDADMVGADRDMVDILVYPNPTRDFINVECTMNDVQYSGIEVIDVYGKVVRTVVGANNDSPTQINVSGLAAGMYFVRVTTDEGVVSKPFVKR